MTATVIIITLKRPDCVRKCLTCLIRQTVRPDQIIIVDGSPDELTRRVVEEFPGVLYLRNDRGEGQAHSRNIGLLSATGEVIAYLDDDAYAHPAWMESLIAPYSDPAVGAVGGRALNNAEGEAELGANEIGLVKPNGLFTSYFAADPGRIVEVDHIIGCNMSFRRSVLAELGGMREDYPGISGIREDTDVCLRVRQLKYKLLYNPAAAADHIAAPQARGRRFDFRYAYFHKRNTICLLLRNFGWSGMLWRYLFKTVKDVARQSVVSIGEALLNNGAVVAGGIVGILKGSVMLLQRGRDPIQHDEQAQRIRAALSQPDKPSEPAARLLRGQTRIGGMKLTFLNTPMGSFTPTHSGAIATIIWELARQAAWTGDEATVLSRSSEHAPYPDVPAIFVDYPAQPAGGPALFSARLGRKMAGWTHLCQGEYARRLAATIRKQGLHEQKLVMFNDPEMAVYLRLQFPGMFIVHWFQNHLPCKAAARREYARSVNLTAACSDFTGRWISEYYGIPDGQVRTLYNAVDAERFSPGFGPKTAPVINFVGRTGIEKAPDLLLAAAKKLAARTKNFSLQIVGSNHWGRFELDGYQRSLQLLASELEDQGIQVRRTGHVDRAALPAEIRKAHIHVVPSRWDEPFGLTTLEGMACGLATAASATGGSPEVIGDAGLLFERDSVDSLAEQLWGLLDNEDHRRYVAARCRRRAEQFTWDKTWQRLSGLLAA